MRLEVAGERAGGPEARRGHGRRLRMAVGRFGPRIERLRLRLVTGDGRATGGQGGRGDCVCRMEIRLRLGGSLLLEDRGADPEAAVTRVAERAARLLDRVLPGEPAGLPWRVRHGSGHGQKGKGGDR